MEAVQDSNLISIEDYLNGELHSDIRHEYMGGFVYAMAGASDDHNAIVGNIFAALHRHLRGQKCRLHVLDSKTRILLPGEEIFYYPDIQVWCDPRDTHQYYKQFPKIVIEVLSPSTEAVDRREKFLNYRQIETLEEYVLVAQDKTEVTVFRRANKWQPEILRSAAQTFRLASLGFQMPVSEIYENVSFGPS